VIGPIPDYILQDIYSWLTDPDRNWNNVQKIAAQNTSIVQGKKTEHMQ